MARSILKAALIASVVTVGGSAAHAQFGFIFGDPPPRPPGDVPGAGPGGRQTAPQPPRQYPPPPQYPPQQYPPQQNSPGPPPGVQTRPMPPPGAAPPPRGPAVAAPPPQRPPARPPGEPPGDEVTIAGPSQRIEHPTAHFSGLDKITGRIINFPVEIGETVQFGALQLTTRACYTRPPTETANTDAFVEVDEVTLQGEVKRIFTGWMFASSPGLHAVEHPIYDVWLTDCRGGSQVLAADGTAAEPPRAQQQQQQKAQPKQTRPPVQKRPPPPPSAPPPPQQPQGFPLFR
jgi:hypothetical protein